MTCSGPGPHHDAAAFEARDECLLASVATGGPVVARNAKRSERAFVRLAVGKDVLVLRNEIGGHHVFFVVQCFLRLIGGHGRRRPRGRTRPRSAVQCTAVSTREPCLLPQSQTLAPSLFKTDATVSIAYLYAQCT